MTACSKPVRRKVIACDRRETYIVTLYPEGRIGVRILRTRREFTIPVEYVYMRAVKLALGIADPGATIRRRSVRRGLILARR